MVLPDEEPDAGHRDENADVKEGFQLGPHRDELAAGHAKKWQGLGLREDALPAQAEDGGFDFGVDGRSLAEDCLLESPPIRCVAKAITGEVGEWLKPAVC